MRFCVDVLFYIGKVRSDRYTLMEWWRDNTHLTSCVRVLFDEFRPENSEVYGERVKTAGANQSSATGERPLGELN